MLKYLSLCVLFLFLADAKGQKLEIETPKIMLSNVPFEIKFSLLDPDHTPVAGDTIVSLLGIHSAESGLFL